MKQEEDDLQTQWVADPLNYVLYEPHAFEFRGRALAHARGERHERDAIDETAHVSRGQG
jgi:hypothetical protein